MNKSKIPLLLPFLLVATVLLCYTWPQFLSSEVPPLLRHRLALGLLVIALIAFFINFDYGLLATGLLLLLATFNIVSLLPNLVTTSFSLNAGMKLSTPPIDWRAFLLLMVYLSTNYSHFRRFFKRKKPNHIEA